MSTINPNESLDNKLEQNKQKKFAEERKVLTKEEVSELETPFGNFDPEKQKQKEAAIAAKIAAEEAKENNDILDFDYGTTIFDKNSIVPQETIDNKFKETQDEEFTLKEAEETYYPGLSNGTNIDTSIHYSEKIQETTDSNIEQTNYEFISNQVGSNVVEKVATEAILGTATGGLSTVINTASTINTVNEISEHIEEKKDDIEMKKNKKSFKEYYGEEAKELYKNKIVIPNDKNNLGDKYKFPDLLEHIASNYRISENQDGNVNKNKDLNSAFKETVKELLEGKHNQNLEKIDNYMNQLSGEESLSDKFKIFKKIDNLIDTSEGTHGAKQAKAFEQVTKSEIIKIKTTKEFANKLIEYIQKNTQEAEFATERLKEITDNLFKEDKDISKKEIIDIISEVSDILGLNIKEY